MSPNSLILKFQKRNLPHITTNKRAIRGLPICELGSIPICELTGSHVFDFLTPRRRQWETYAHKRKTDSTSLLCYRGLMRIIAKTNGFSD